MTEIAPHKTLVFTVCTTGQYPFAKVLAESLPDNITFKIGLLENTSTIPNATTLTDLSHQNLLHICQRYNDTAFTAAMVPFFADYFLQKEPIENIIYFDPTVQVFGHLETIIATLQTADILLTPRITKKFGESSYGDEKLFLNTGMYDAGFWAVRKTENTFRFLKWWQDRLADRAHFDLCHGMNHAQLWLNYVPIYFKNVIIVKNIAWNVGLQNLHERVLTMQHKKWLVNLTESLVFVNFRETLHKTPAIKSLLKTSGAEILVTEYQNKLKKYSSTLPFIFSLHQTLNPVVSSWKSVLRQTIQKIIDSINHFPLYH